MKMVPNYELRNYTYILPTVLQMEHSIFPPPPPSQIWSTLGSTTLPAGRVDWRLGMNILFYLTKAQATQLCYFTILPGRVDRGYMGIYIYIYIYI